MMTLFVRVRVPFGPERAITYHTRAMKNKVSMIFLLVAALSRATMIKGRAIKQTSVSMFITPT